jgi:hypothetical protein
MESGTVAVHLTKLVGVWLHKVKVYLIVCEELISAAFRFLEILKAL